mgnify:CR=1 FL=1
MNFSEDFFTRLRKVANILRDASIILHRIADSHNKEPDIDMVVTPDEMPAYVKVAIELLFRNLKDDLPRGINLISISVLSEGSGFSEKDRSIIETVAPRVKYPIEIHLGEMTLTVSKWDADSRLFSYDFSRSQDEDDDFSVGSQPELAIIEMFEKNHSKIQTNTSVFSLKSLGLSNIESYLCKSALSEMAFPVSFAIEDRYFTLMWWDSLTEEISLKIIDVKPDHPALAHDLARYLNENMPAKSGRATIHVWDRHLARLLDSEQYPFSMTVNDRFVDIESWNREKTFLQVNLN